MRSQKSSVTTLMASWERPDLKPVLRLERGKGVGEAEGAGQGVGFLFREKKAWTAAARGERVAE